MKIPILFAVVVFSFLSVGCNQETAKSGSANDSIAFDATNQNKPHAIDSRKPYVIDSLVKHIRLQKEKNTSGFEIISSIAYSNNDSSFYILNFIESYDQYHFNSYYSIAVNTDVTIEINNNVSREEDKTVQDKLQESGISFAFFRGNLKASLDFTMDGSNDFILKNETHFKTDVNESEQIILFNGISQLKPTQIIAQTSYSNSDEWEGITGQKEEFIFKKNNQQPVTIILQHYNDDFNHEPLHREHIEYSLLWKWNVESKYWDMGVNCTKCGNYLFSHFTDLLTQLTEKDGQFTIEENCQRGGNDFFQLEKQKTALTEMYSIKNNSDEVEIHTMAVLHIADINEHYQILYVSNFNDFLDDPENYINGVHPLNKTLEKWEVRKNTVADAEDIIRIGPLNTPYTSKNYRYPTIECP